MALTLTARATLDNRPFLASLRAMQAATGNLSATAIAGNQKQIASENNLRKAKMAGAAQTVAATRAATQAQAATMRATRAASEASRVALSTQRYLFHDLSRQMASYTLGLAAPTIATVAMAAKWEDAFSNVRRTADPEFSAVQTKVDDLRKSLVSMVQAMPMSFSEVTEIATLANQMGIASSQTADFTRAVAQFSATSGVSVDQTATAFGRLTSIMGNNRIGFNEMADSILKVGVNSVATESEIINITTQISSIAAGAKFSTEEMIGLSGALASVRVPPELSRGVVTRTFGRIEQAVSRGGAELNTLARLSGRTAEQFSKDWRSGGAGGAFNDFLQGLQKAGANARTEIESLGITSVRDVPVLLRLANAADSEGNVGMLLTQTMNDAQNAAGETQRQYGIMAETIWAKIKVLGNNVFAMFDAIGQSNLGSFGNMLDNMTSGIRRFTNSLDKPMQILGGLELPWTNAEALGFVTQLSLVAAGLTGIASIGLKMGAAVVGMKQLGEVMGGAGVSAWLTGSARGGRAGAGIAAEIAATTAAAGATRPVFAAMRSGAVAAGTAWANMGRSTMFASRALSNPAILNSGRAFEGVIRTAPAAQGALGNLVRFGLHPVTLAIGAATTAAVVWSKSFFQSGTDFGAFTERLASIDTGSVENLNRVLGQVAVSGESSFWRDIGNMDFTAFSRAEKTIRPFERGLIDVRKSLITLSAIRDQAGTGILSNVLFDRAVDRGGLRASQEAIEGIGGSIQGLLDAGNKGAAVNILRSIAGSGAELKEAMAISPEIDSMVKSMLAIADVKESDKALRELASGGLNEVYEAYTGLQDLSFADFFEGDVEAAVAYQDALDKASAAFVDFGAAMESATTFSEEGVFQAFDLTKFGEGLAQSVVEQEQWQTDMIAIAGETTVGVVEELANLGPAAAPQVKALADALRSEDPEMRAAGENLIAQMEAGVNSKISGFGGTLGQVMSDKAWLRKAMGDLDFANEIANNLSMGDLSALRAAGANSSQEFIYGVMDALHTDKISVDQALQALELNIPVETFIRQNKAEEDLRSMIAEKYEVDVSAEFDSTSTVRDLKSLINDPELSKMKIDGSLSLAEAYLTVPEFQAWADANGITIPADADTVLGEAKMDDFIRKAEQPATKPIDAETWPFEDKVQSIEAAAKALVTKPVDANPALANTSVDSLETKIQRLVRKPVDANTNAATGKVKSLDADAKSLVMKPVDANTGPAQAKILALNGLNTSSTHTHRIVVQTVGGGAGVRDVRGGGTLPQADGGVVSYYANGGVRENHVAQIAPAGAMRMWAEPETGGEAYIPLSPTKRARSLGILSEVANRFGLALSRGSDTAHFANGGQYQMQQMSRVRSSAPVRNSFASGLTASDKQFFSHLFRTVQVTAEGQAIAGLTNDINTTNARFGR